MPQGQGGATLFDRSSKPTAVPKTTHLFRRLAIGSAAAVLSATVLVRAQAPAAKAQAAVSAPVDFAKDIQPVFEQVPARSVTAAPRRGPNCGCTRRSGSGKAASRVPSVLPGNSHNSELMRRVLDPNDDDRMPLDADPLPAETIARLRAWIDQGAPMPASTAAVEAIDEHWAYVKPSRPELPVVSRGEWARTAIDRFVLARLEREKLTPSAEASRPTLLRRVTFDLTGLPPTPEELDAFLADTAPDAYERVVDRLLASPRYGERWARPWLDLARYADTNGYEKDNRRDIWKYRDWVIDAFNRDLPFDQFTVEQIAGDMLAKPTIEQKIATGFHRNAMTNEEGGVDPEESRYEVLVDRANTTATVFLGSTLGVCPVPQPQVRSVHAEGLLPAARVLRERRLRQPDIRRRHPPVRADARSRHS